MATAQQGIMALPEMSQQAAPAAVSPEQMAVFDQMRQNISPKEMSDELLGAAAQVDPQAVAEFKAELDALDVPPEILDLLDQLIDEILANPENYEAIKEKYRAQGIPEDMLPEEFDAELFGALNIALEQLRGEPAGPQAFAKGGIAELSPVAKALASYGRNGDTMLAHITPAEARMLKKRGGSGTINPVTGLPEFANIFSKIGKAVKKFAGSTVGKLIIGTALFMVAGPAAAQLLTISSPMAVAGVSGFVAGAGTTLLAGGNLRDALKAGAIGGITAGAMQGLTGMGPKPLGGAESAAGTAGTAGAGTAGTTPLSSLPLSEPLPTLPGAPAAPTLPGASAAPTTPLSISDPLAGARFAPTSAPVVSVAPPATAPFELSGRLDLGPGTRPSTAAFPTVSVVPPPATAPANTAMTGGTAAQQAAAAKSPVPTVGQSVKTIGEGLGLGQGPASWETFKQGVSDLFVPQGASQEVIDARVNDLMAKNPRIPYADALKRVTSELTPGALRSYGPMAAAGLGIMGLAGGFQSRPAEQSPLFPLFTGGPGSATDLLARNPSQYFIQYLPGVGYTSGRPRFAEGGIVDIPAFAEGGKVLNDAQKNQLANALMYAQQNDVWSGFNGLVDSLGLTQADLKSNFPSISQEAINETVAKGAIVPVSRSDATGSTSSQSDTLSGARDLNIKTQTDGGDATFSGNNVTETSAGNVTATTADRTLSNAEKYALADVLTTAQRTANYAPVSAEISRLGLTQADLLSNFPNINLEGIQEHTGRGVVSPMYAGDVATGVRGLTEGQRTQLGNMFLQAQQSGDYTQFNRLLQLYQLQPQDLTKLYPALDMAKIQQYMQEKPNTVAFPAPRVDKVFGVGTAAPTNVEVASPTLRGTARPMDARSESIRQYLGGVGPGAKIESIVSAMDRAGISPEQVADVMNMGYAPVQAEYFKAKNAMILGGYDVDPFTGARTPVAPAGMASSVAAASPAAYSGIFSGMMPLTTPQKQMLANTLVSGQQTGNFTPFNQTAAMYGVAQPDVLYNFPQVTPGGISEAVARGARLPGGTTEPTTPAVLQRTPVEFNMPLATDALLEPKKFMNVGGIAALGDGGYPRRTGQIDGPGTETSDSIPAMLSDGEFVMTAKAVRGAGNGDRRKGAKKMYALMHRLEKNAARG
jgi:uncharacterized protein (DUF433 family)